MLETSSCLRGPRRVVDNSYRELSSITAHRPHRPDYFAAYNLLLLSIPPSSPTVPVHSYYHGVKFSVTYPANKKATPPKTAFTSSLNGSIFVLFS